MTTRNRQGFPASLREIANIQRGSEFRLTKAAGAASPDVELTKTVAATQRVFVTNIEGYNASSEVCWLHCDIGSTVEWQLRIAAGASFNFEFNNIPIWGLLAGADLSLKMEGLSGTPDLTGSYINVGGWEETVI